MFAFAHKICLRHGQQQQRAIWKASSEALDDKPGQLDEQDLDQIAQISHSSKA